MVSIEKSFCQYCKGELVEQKQNYHQKCYEITIKFQHSHHIYLHIKQVEYWIKKYLMFSLWMFYNELLGFYVFFVLAIFIASFYYGFIPTLLFNFQKYHSFPGIIIFILFFPPTSFIILYFSIKIIYKNFRLYNYYFMLKITFIQLIMSIKLLVNHVRKV